MTKNKKQVKKKKIPEIFFFKSVIKKIYIKINYKNKKIN